MADTNILDKAKYRSYLGYSDHYFLSQIISEFFYCSFCFTSMLFGLLFTLKKLYSKYSFDGLNYSECNELSTSCFKYSDL